MTKSRGINAPKHKWTPEQDAALRNQYPDMRAADVAAALGIRLPTLYARAKRLGLTKSEEFKSSAASGRLDGVRGSATRFASGHVPWTKGQKGRRAFTSVQTRNSRKANDPSTIWASGPRNCIWDMCGSRSLTGAGQKRGGRSITYFGSARTDPLRRQRTCCHSATVTVTTSHSTTSN